MFAAGLGVYSLALVATAPATLADAALQAISEGSLRLVEARGTTWSGAAQLEIRDSQGRGGLAKPVSWNFAPGALLRGRVAYVVTVDAGSKPFPVMLSWSRLELEDVDLRLPAAALGIGVAKLAPLELTGEVRVRLPSFAIERRAMHGNAVLQWSTAGSRLSPVAPLGDYELRLEANGPAIRASLNTLQGPVQISGEGSWSAGANPAFRAIVQVPGPLRPQLAPLLRLIAVERPNGRFDLQLN